MNANVDEAGRRLIAAKAESAIDYVQKSIQRHSERAEHTQEVLPPEAAASQLLAALCALSVYEGPGSIMVESACKAAAHGILALQILRNMSAQQSGPRTVVDLVEDKVGLAGEGG